MKNIYLSFLLLAFLFTSCEKNSDLLETTTNTPSSEALATIDFSWWVIVEEEESLHNWGGLYGTSLSNVSVKLMFMEDVLWEDNTDYSGRVTFPEQTVPAEGAYFLFETSGYHPLIVAIEGETIPLWRVNMVRNTYPNINGEAIKDADSYITLTGLLQDPSTAREAWLYITNSDNEIVGNCIIGPEVPRFYMTTIPGEDLFLHYNVVCGGDGVVPLGSLSESQDIGVLVDQSFDFSYDTDLIYLDNVTECSTDEKLYGYELLYKVDDLTIQAGGNSGFRIPDCYTMDYPILLSVATQDPRKYIELTINHTPGQQTDVPDQSACDDDDTFLSYTIGGNSPGGGDVFTFANILPDGHVVLKQAQTSLNDDSRFSMVLDGSTTGSHNSLVNIVVRDYITTNSWTSINSLGGNGLNVTITTNDGTFIEGTFDGEVMDTDEVSLGIMEGNFKARIQ